MATPIQAQVNVDDAAITRTALDYIEGYYDGDAARMERSLHPQLAKRIMKHMAKLDGRWVIVNVLWELRPSVDRESL